MTGWRFLTAESALSAIPLYFLATSNPMADRFDDATQVSESVSRSCSFLILTVSFPRRCRRSSKVFSSGSRRRRVYSSPSTPLPACAGTSAFSLRYHPPNSAFFTHLTGTFARHRCITGTPSTRFSRGEESCLVNCVERFLDTSLFMVKKVESQRQDA